MATVGAAPHAPTTHTEGAIGWSWSKVTGDGRGSFYLMTDPERGLDAAYGIVGNVVEGLEILRASRSPRRRSAAGTLPSNQ